MCCTLYGVKMVFYALYSVFYTRSVHFEVGGVPEDGLFADYNARNPSTAVAPNDLIVRGESARARSYYSSS